MEQVEHFLKNLPLFKTFTSEELKNLIEKSRIKTFEPREAIIHFGQPGKFMGIIIEGEAEVVIADETGEQQRLDMLKQGDLLGEMGLLTGEPTSADVIAVERCRLFLIPQETFSLLLVSNPNALQVMTKTITERLRNRQKDEDAQDRVENAWQNATDPYGMNLSPATPMKILVINCGSSSLKYSYFDTDNEANNMEGMVERIGLDNACLISSSQKVEERRLKAEGAVKYALRGRKLKKELGSINHSKAFKAVVDLLTSKNEGVVKDLNEINAVGHRVVHGGDKYGNAVIINDEVIKDIDKYSSLAPLHNPLNLMAIKESIKLMPKVPQIAVFDTGFHQKMPLHASLYGLPYDFYEKDHIRRYGFHGISHNYVALQAATHLKRNFRLLKIITCHLGNGASICAIDHGRSVDTSMGLTPLEGLVMGTRCGDLDPSIILYLLKEKKLSIEEVEEILNRQSGLKGLSGISSDFREIEEAANKGDSRAILTVHVFCYRIRKYIGAYIAAMGGADALVFTGGIGEGSAWVRGLTCQSLSYMGIQVDDILNKIASPGPDNAVDISSENSRVKILAVSTDEGRMIARETIRTLKYQNVDNAIKSQKQKEIPIEVSAHHIHLSRKEVDVLFGQGYKLTIRSELSQPGQFACEETVALIGPKGRVERLRILGPVRDETQVEIAITEEFKLGIKVPIRPSGDLDGTPGITLEGPKGTSEVSYGVINALRHIHMTPEDALSLSIKDRDIVMVKVQGERTLVFGSVLVRVKLDFQLSMHIDTDEANAANIKTGMIGSIVSVQVRR